MADPVHEPVHHPPKDPLPATPDRMPLVTSLVDTARIFSAYAYPISADKLRKAPFETFLLNGKASAETAVQWGFLLSEMKPEHSQQIRMLFTNLSMRTAIADYEEHFRKALARSARGAHFRRHTGEEPRPAA